MLANIKVIDNVPGIMPINVAKIYFCLLTSKKASKYEHIGNGINTLQRTKVYKLFFDFSIKLYLSISFDFLINNFVIIKQTKIEEKTQLI